MVDDERTERMTFRFSPQEVEMMRALAGDRGVSVSDIVRMLVRDSFRSKFGDKPPKKPKPSK